MKTKIEISQNQFLINGRPSYSELPNPNPAALGLLWNQRVINGVFDDRVDKTRFNQFKMGVFDAEKNTDNLIASLPEWHKYGLRAFTVGFQGGGTRHCAEITEVDNNPFGRDGKTLDPAYAARMHRIITAADELGMVVIVCFLYWAQILRMDGEEAAVSAVKTGCEFLRGGGYTNVMLDVVNEYGIGLYNRWPLLHKPENMARLIANAREWSGGMPSASSNGGGRADKEVIAASDIALIHGNNLYRGQLYDFFNKAHKMADGKPVICNEDSPCYSYVDVGLETYVSWGYYNNYTKQIPPADYGVTPGEDLFFARRMARATGIPIEELPLREQFYLAGLEPWTAVHGRRFLRLAAEFPENIRYVDFYLNGEKIYRAYDEPFFLHREMTWLATPREVSPDDREWKAVVTMCDGTVIEKTEKIEK